MYTLGILGGGQLGRMTALAALRLGLDVRLLADAATGPEAAFAGATVGDWHDADVLRAFATACDAVTTESEWAPADRLLEVCPAVPVFPHPDTLRLVRHKGRQRDALAAAGLPGPAYRRCASRAALREAAGALGLPLVAKRYEGSYDGYGNATCRTPEDLEAAWEALAGPDGLLAEAFVPFEAELAVTVVRARDSARDGARVVYPVVRTEQRDHRCHAATLPAGLPEAVGRAAQRVACRAAEAVGAVGACTAELFLTPDGDVLVNELAPRPHNTAHLTIEAHHTSQFENHVRAVLGLPLGATDLRVPAACMVNVLGRRDGTVRPGALADALAVPSASVHVYGKRDVRPRRKMGHVTATADTPEAARDIAERAAARLIL